MTHRMLPTRSASSSTEPPSWPWWAWTLTLLSYVALGYVLKAVVLNWIVGPLYPLLVMYLLPAGLRRLRRRPGPEADRSVSSAELLA